MLPLQTSLERTCSSTSSVLTSEPVRLLPVFATGRSATQHTSDNTSGKTKDTIPDAPQISQNRHPRRAGTAPVIGKSDSQLSLPIRSKTLGDAPNLNGRIRKLGQFCFAIGGFADIWLGEFVADSKKKVRTCAVEQYSNLVE